jgi:hypothetical protein
MTSGGRKRAAALIITTGAAKPGMVAAEGDGGINA